MAGPNFRSGGRRQRWSASRWRQASRRRNAGARSKGCICGQNVSTGPLTETESRAAGVIDSSLFEVAHDAGLPASVIGEIIKASCYDVDFQRDIQDGDAFEVVYERYENGDGEFARTGKMLYAALTMDGETKPIQYFEIRRRRRVLQCRRRV